MTQDEAKQLLPIIEAYANGEDIQIEDRGIWSNPTLKNLSFSLPPCQYRIKPKYININGCEVPMPVRQPLKDREIYFLASIEVEEPTELPWVNDNSDNRWLKLGIIHKTKEAAQIHVDALLSFTKH